MGLSRPKPQHLVFCSRRVPQLVVFVDISWWAACGACVDGLWAARGRRPGRARPGPRLVRGRPAPECSPRIPPEHGLPPCVSDRIPTEAARLRMSSARYQSRPEVGGTRPISSGGIPQEHRGRCVPRPPAIRRPGRDVPPDYHSAPDGWSMCAWRHIPSPNPRNVSCRLPMDGLRAPGASIRFSGSPQEHLAVTGED
jgi:hypothetical protein